MKPTLTQEATLYAKSARAFKADLKKLKLLRAGDSGKPSSKFNSQDCCSIMNTKQTSKMPCAELGLSHTILP